MLLSNQVALIVGASKGIGRAIALRFAAEGCHIAFTSRHQDDSVTSLLHDVTAMGVRASFYQGDATDFAQAQHIVDQVVLDFGSLDILVCNVGMAQDALILRMTEQQWNSVIDVNLKSVFNYCHATAPHMVHQRHGSIIAMSSVVGADGNIGQVNYAAAKAGIIGLIKSLSKELGSRNIRANAIAPGYIISEMTAPLSDDKKASYVNRISLRRAGTIDEVASVALFLASDMSSYVSGQVIAVDGYMD